MWGTPVGQQTEINVGTQAGETPMWGTSDGQQSEANVGNTSRTTDRNQCGNTSRTTDKHQGGEHQKDNSQKLIWGTPAGQQTKTTVHTSKELNSIQEKITEM